MYNSQDLQKVLELREAILGGNEKRLKQQRDAGKLTARERIAKIADDGSFVELFALVSQNQEGAGVVSKTVPCTSLRRTLPSAAALWAKRRPRRL